MPAVGAAPASPGEALRPVLDYLASIDGAGAQAHHDRIDPLVGEDARWENPMAWREPATAPDLMAVASALRLATEDLIVELRTRRPEMAKRGEGDYLEAMHYASVA